MKTIFHHERMFDRMKIIRYSIDGFKPQYQSKHLSDIDLELNES